MTSPKRNFILNENVSESSVKEIITGIFAVNRYDDEQQREKNNYIRKPIEIIVNTYGGSVYDGFALVSSIDNSVTPVHTYCLGKAMSMGFIIFAAGHKRFAHPLATFMYHQVSNALKGKLNEIELGTDQMKRLQSKYDGYILEVTNIPESKLEEAKDRKEEWYIFADKAMEYGLVDELMSSRRKDGTRGMTEVK